MALTTSAHTPAARLDAHNCHGYPWRPACSCGWQYGQRYVSDFAAASMAKAHAEGRL